uniref:Putative plant transposon protein domain-containing protein n=1 Tax=Solanum tuberosum TaxID=4113 RepID=M1DYX5_SOLTU
MAPKAKNVVGSKRTRKGEASGFGNKELAQKFGKKAFQRYGLTWFECQREAKYMGDEYVDSVRLQSQFPDIYRIVVELGLQFVFDHPGDCNLSLVREFYANWLTETKYKAIPIRGRDVKFSARLLNELLGTPNCDADDFNRLKEKPPYRDIRHTLCGIESTCRWGRSKDIGRHSNLHFANFNLVARVWLKLVCSVLLPVKHLTEVTRDRVVLVYMLMKGMPINVGAILRQNMMKFRNNLRWRFCYGGLITRFLRTQGIEEEACDMTIALHPDLMSKLVDVTRTKALDTSHGHVLSAQERQARNDSVIARMFGMAELQLRIGDRPVTDEKMVTMAERYPLTESAAFLCRTGPAFLEPLDDDEVTADEAMENEEANALMVFDHGDDEA